VNGTLSVTLSVEYDLWMCEKRVLRSMYGARAEEVKGSRHAYSQALLKFYSQADILTVTKSKTVRRAARVS
jgi:hypothetical protein